MNLNEFHNMLFVNLQIMSTKNKASKAKQLTNHTSGPKPFVAVSYDAVRFLFDLMFAYNECQIKLHDICCMLINNNFILLIAGQGDWKGA